MSATEDLINFDIIETQKENIQSLPQGRSAKALVSAFAPSTVFSPASTPGATRNLNDAIREEFEMEIIAISDLDDPLDVYDRYVKWTMNTYPSAQATPESQLRPLLERATRVFQTASHYKNDPRYLKLWLTYIRFFSDAPRETFAYLARHNIGEGLALFYEEFAAWFENASRWTQAEEVFKLGLEREARPAERLLRKFGEFQHRFQERPRDADEPSSPALPTIRPALVTKLDPFATTPRPIDPQAQIIPSAIGSSTTRAGKQKLAVFSDADGAASNAMSGVGDASKGWDNIGSIQERKKENVMEARPWAGETMKLGKKTGGAPKMMVFKDELEPQIKSAKSQYTCQQKIVHPRTGKTETIYVDLETVYPNPDNIHEEYSFEELMAKSRGWLDKQWLPEKAAVADHTNVPAITPNLDENVTADGPNSTEAVLAISVGLGLALDESSGDPSLLDSTLSRDVGQENKGGRLKKRKIMEVKAETQTVKTNLESPTGPKLKRKNSSEPTMTLHTRAATDDILDIFNQPLRNMGPIGSHRDSCGESEYDEDDYTSAGESTGTGRISGTSEFGDDDETGMGLVAAPESTEPGSVSEWSDFTASKHLPPVDVDLMEDRTESLVLSGRSNDEQIEELVTPVSPQQDHGTDPPRYIPIPPDDYEPSIYPYRDPVQVSQNRLPFMTPIVEKTESSMILPTAAKEKDYFSSKTPSSPNDDNTQEIDRPLVSSPFNPAVDGASSDRPNKTLPSTNGTKYPPSPPQRPQSPIIKDAQCNPVDESIRATILATITPPLSAFPTYHDHRPSRCLKGPEIRKFVKALAKPSKSVSDKTATHLSTPPVLHFPHSSAKPYTIRRELGKGAFAPVYLAEQHLDNDDDDADDDETTSSPPAAAAAPRFSAIKAEEPPSAWEFYIMSAAHARLAGTRARASVATPYGLHLFTDEGYLVEEYRDQGTLLDLVNIARSDPTIGGAGGVLDEAVVMFFAVEILRTVEGLHAVGVMHGDLKADNFLVRLSGLSSSGMGGMGTGGGMVELAAGYDADGGGGWGGQGVSLIDFGRGIDMWAFGGGVAFIADWKTTRWDCVEMRELRPWTWQIDYWGVAGVVHVLLFGKWIEDVVEKGSEAAFGLTSTSTSPSTSLTSPLTTTRTTTRTTTTAIHQPKRYKLKEGLKRYWQTELWLAFFDALMNPTAHASAELSGRMPLLRRLRVVREGLEGWLEANAERRGLKGGLRRLEERVRERERERERGRR